jgi:hypothetical protein
MGHSFKKNPDVQLPKLTFAGQAWVVVFDFQMGSVFVCETCQGMGKGRKLMKGRL